MKAAPTPKSKTSLNQIGLQDCKQGANADIRRVSPELRLLKDSRRASSSSLESSRSLDESLHGFYPPSKRRLRNQTDMLGTTHLEPLAR